MCYHVAREGIEGRLKPKIKSKVMEIKLTPELKSMGCKSRPAHPRGHEPEDAFICAFKCFSGKAITTYDLYLWKNGGDLAISLRHGAEGGEYYSPLPLHIMIASTGNLEFGESYRRAGDILTTLGKFKLNWEPITK